LSFAEDIFVPWAAASISNNPSADLVQSNSLSIGGRQAPLCVAIVALIAVNALWGLSFPIMKSLNEIVDHFFDLQHQRPTMLFLVVTSSWLIGLRFVFATLLLMIFCWRLVLRASYAEWKAGLWIGLFFYIGLVAQVMGLATIPASRSGFLTSLTAVFTPLIATFLLRRPPNRYVVAGIVTALMGVAVLTGLVVIDARGVRIPSDALATWQVGDSLTTLGALFFTMQILLLDQFSRRMNSIMFTPGMFVGVVFLAFFTMVVLMMFFGVESTPGKSVTFVQLADLARLPMVWGILLFLGGFCSLVSFRWMNKYQPSVTVVQASILYSLEPVFASSWALVLPGIIGSFSGFDHRNEFITTNLLLGGALILLANTISICPPRTDESVSGSE